MNSELQNYPPQLQQPQPEEVHLQDYINVIYRRRKTFVIAFCVVFIGVALYTFTMKPIYEASATLHVKDEKGKSELLDVLSMNSANPVDSELEILKSRTNAEHVVKQLHLNWKVSDKSEGVTFKLLEFTSDAEKPSYKIELTGAGAYTVKNDDGKIIDAGQSGILLRSKGVTLLVNDLQGKKGDSFHLDLLPFNAVVNGLRKTVKATEVGKKTNIMSVAYSDTDPQRARDVVNTLVRVYLDQSVGFKTEEASRTVGFVEDQLQGLRNDLDNAEKNLQSYKSSSGVVMLDAAAQQLIGKLSDTEKTRAGITLQKKGVEFALASLKNASRSGQIYAPSITQSNPVMSGMASKLAELEVQKQALMSDSTEAHPAVKAVKAQIDELQKKIQATYESELNDLTKQETGITRQLGGYEGQLKGLPAAERDLARLTRVTKVNADIYTFLLQKHEEARIAKASTISNINIVDPAIIPDQPVKPQKKKNLLLGMLVGGMLGVGLAFFREYLDDTIKDAEGMKRELKWPLLAVIPHIPHVAGNEGQDEERKTSLLTHMEPKSQAAEAFRSLRTGIHFSSVNREHQVILLSSTFPGEGKSTISTNLASILCQMGARVIILDCDLRRSTLHEKFNCSKEPGLTNLLAGDARFEEVVRQTPIPGLDFISAGITPPNPSELIGSTQMRELIERLRPDYDSILIDAPPMLAVTDASLLTSLADMVLVVVEAGRVPLKAARQMRELLQDISAPVAGMILNDKSGKGSEHYGYGYYGGRYYGYYGYGYGYQEIEDHKKKKSYLSRLPFFRNYKF
jgi:capsular exopolysaccharide synthesis family protein